jgi:hypothetical protein
MAESTKCAHPACECVVSKGAPFGKYCSEYCREKSGMSELHCRCGHPECK